MLPVAALVAPGDGLFLFPSWLLLRQGPSHPDSCPLSLPHLHRGRVAEGRNLGGFPCGFRFVRESDRCHRCSETRNPPGGQNSCGFRSEIPVNFKKSKPSQSRNPLSLVTQEANSRCAKLVGREPRVPVSPGPGEIPLEGHGLGLSS